MGVGVANDRETAITNVVANLLGLPVGILVVGGAGYIGSLMVKMLRQAGHREAIETVRCVIGHAIPAVVGQKRAGDAPRLVADAQRARAELRWSQRYPDRESIVSHAWEWERKHIQWRHC